MSVFLPRLAHEDRERTPRRHEPSTAPPSEHDMDEPPSSPKRKMAEAAEAEPRGKVARSSPLRPSQGVALQPIAEETAPMDAASVPLPTDDDDLVIEDVFFTELPADAPEGWRVVDGCLELDDVLMAAIRKGEVNERKLSPEDRIKFVDGKRKELDQYFGNAVWKFATTESPSRTKGSSQLAGSSLGRRLTQMMAWSGGKRRPAWS